MNIQEALNVFGLEGELTVETIKKAYKKLALKYHPDRNPLGEELMKAVNTAFDFLMRNAEFINKAQSKKPEHRYNYGEEMEAVLSVLAGLTGINYEVIGNWIWIDGETKPHRVQLGELGCKWAPKKMKWYYRPEEHRSVGNRKERSFDEIRAKYGSSGKHSAEAAKAVYSAA